MGKSRIKKNFYAVRVGRIAGVFKTWDECEAQVMKFAGARYKGFANYDEAESFVNSVDSGHSSRGRGRSRGSRSRATSSQVSTARERYFGNFTGARTSRYFGSDASGSCGSNVDDFSLSSSLSSSSCAFRPVVYSDGCCLNNGYATARAGIGVYWGEGSAHNVSERLQGHQTNQRAELESACRAIESAIQQGFPSIELKTDSTYTIKSATQWIEKWKVNGWRTADKKDVKNKQDVQRLDELCKRVDVKWTHVKGHIGIAGNEAADSLAKAGSKKT